MDIFIEFSIIIVIAAVLSGIVAKLKQPAILGYIITGIVAGVIFPNLHADSPQLELLSKFGVSLLLFVLGLELDIGEVRKLGKVALVTGIGQIITTTIIGFGICLWLGFPTITALAISVGLTLSSTIVIVKLLTYKRELETLHGKITIAFLLVQDFIAILLLLGLSISQQASGASWDVYLVNLGLALGKGILIVGGLYLFVRFIFNRFLNSIRQDTELLFVAVIAWALAISSLMGAEVIGFSIEIGALIAGILLASRFESLQLEKWVRPLRDFFIIIFFVVIGLELDLSNISGVMGISTLLSVFVLIGNPIIVMVILSLLRYSSKTAFFTSLAVAQVSEFSLILMKMAYDMQLVDKNALTIITVVGGITMTLSSLAIYYNEQLYQRLEWLLKLFDRGRVKFADTELDLDADSNNPPRIVMFGCHRMGNYVLQNTRYKKRILIVDINPYNISNLLKRGYRVMFGDISDTGMYEKFQLNTAKIVISTVPGVKDNTKLFNYLASLENKPLIIFTARDEIEARSYYEIGADLVIYPHMLGGEIIREIITTESITLETWDAARIKRLLSLETFL